MYCIHSDTNRNNGIGFIVSIQVLQSEIAFVCSFVQKTSSSRHVNNTNQTHPVSATTGPVKVGPVKIGWHYANLLQTYVQYVRTGSKTGITDDSFQAVYNLFFLWETISFVMHFDL